MSHYKNRKPKSYKGCCGMCCLQTTDGRRCGRTPSIQELRACPPVEDWETDLELLSYDVWDHADGWDPEDESFREAGLCSKDCPTCREECGLPPYSVEPLLQAEP